MVHLAAMLFFTGLLFAALTLVTEMLRAEWPRLIIILREAQLVEGYGAVGVAARRRLTAA